MALSLNILRGGGGAGDTFNLPATKISIDYDMAPKITPLPATDPIIFNLGQWQLSIIIEGTVRTTIGTNLMDGATPIADKDDLENMLDPTLATAVVWYDKTNTFTDNSTTPAQAYTVQMVKLTLERTEAQEFWRYSLRMMGFRN